MEKGIDDFMTLKSPGSKVLVGDGPERPRLERQYPDAHFLGFRHAEDYARTLASADVVVFPSRTDTFGLVMLEAMACGTPVAAYDAPSPLDVVNHNVTGCIADTLEEAVDQASRLDRDAVRQGSMHYSWETCAAMFEILAGAMRAGAQASSLILNLPSALFTFGSHSCCGLSPL